MLQESARFTYLFPAEPVEGDWRGWLPHYATEHGLEWRREDLPNDPGKRVPDRTFRRRLLDTRAGTAIEPETDTAADGSLRETECLGAMWRRNGAGGEPSPAALVGYVFLRDGDGRLRVEAIDTLFLGGDTRYGLGRVRLVECDVANGVFGNETRVSAGTPAIVSAAVLAHASSGEDLIGALERVAGWDRLKASRVTHLSSSVAWTPGSSCRHGERRIWRVRGDGIWQPGQ